MSRLLNDMASTPLAAPALALAVGIVCGRFLDGIWPAAAFGAIAILCCIFYILPYLLPNKEKRLLASYSRRDLIWGITLPLAALMGFMLIRSSIPDNKGLPRLPFVKGTVLERHTTTKGDNLTVEISDFISDTGLREPVSPVKMQVFADGTNVQPGDIIIFRANPEPLTKSSTSYGWLYSRGIDYTSSANSKFIRIVGKDNSLRFKALAIRDHIVSTIDDSNLNSSAKALVTAMLTGDRSTLTTDIKEDFAAAGLAHILALSGLHVGIIILLLGWILYPLNLTGQRSVRYILICAGVITFAFITGFSASVSRAAVMSVCLMGAMTLQRRNANINALSLAAILILAFDPRALFDAGFQLSFICTLTILCIIPLLQSGRKPTFTGKLIMAVVIPCCIFIVTWPLTAWHFHSVPLLFLPLNLIAVPLLPLFMACALIYTVLLMFGVESELLCRTLDYICDALTFSAKAISDIDFASIQLFPHWLIPVTALFTFGLIFYWLRVRTRTALWLSGWGVGLLLSAIIILPAMMPEDTLMISALYDRTEVEYTLRGKTEKVTLRDGSMTKFTIRGTTILNADADMSRYAESSCGFAHILLIGPNFHGSHDSLINRCNPQLILLSPRLREQDAEALTKAVQATERPIHDLRSSPFVLIIK